MPNSIPEDIKRFLLLHIDTIAEWEGLLLLRNEAQHQWTVEALAQRLYISLGEADALLNKLVERGFVAAEGASGSTHYVYNPKRQDQRDKITLLAEYYAKHLVPITNLIHSKTKSKIQKFADAFRIGKEQ